MTVASSRSTSLVWLKQFCRVSIALVLDFNFLKIADSAKAAFVWFGARVSAFSNLLIASNKSIHEEFKSLVLANIDPDLKERFS